MMPDLHSMKMQRQRRISLLLMGFLATVIFTLAGCASWQPPPEFDVSVLRARAVTAEKSGVRLSAAVLSRDDNLRMFGVDLNKKQIQPVWIEIHNETSQTLWLLSSGTDPDIFSPLEVSWSFHAYFSSGTNARLDAQFQSLSFQNPVPAHSTRSGILYTNPYERIRLLNVDLLGQGQIFPFTLFPEIPDDPEHAQAHQLFARLADDNVENYQNLAALRTRLEKLPCCSTNADGTKPGAPLNLVVIGSIEDISAAVVRRDYRVNISDSDNKQYVYGRPPDVVIRKSGLGGLPASWIRAWCAPFRYQGKAVLIAQTGRPVGGRFMDSDELDLKLHPNVDEVRNVFISDMMYSGGLGALAFITGAGVVDKDAPRKTFDGSSYYTDGIRVVMFFVTRPRSISDVEILDWYPAIKLREKAATNENK